MKNYKVTIIGTCIIVFSHINFMLFDIELFEEFISFMNSLEHLEVDEIVIPAILITIFFLIDKLNIYRHNIHENEQIKEYEDELETTSYLLKDFLSQVQIFKIEAENSKDFDKKTLQRFETLTKEINSQIEKLNIK